MERVDAQMRKVVEPRRKSANITGKLVDIELVDPSVCPPLSRHAPTLAHDPFEPGIMPYMPWFFGVLSRFQTAMSLVVASVLIAVIAWLWGQLMMARDEITYLTALSSSQHTAVNAAGDIFAVQVQAAAHHSAELEQQLSQQGQASAALQTALNGVQGGLTFLAKERANDPELLEKYSKVFFLNENYGPASLAEVPASFSLPTTTLREVQGQVLPFLTTMLNDADMAGVHLRIASAYRSFYDQSALKNAYTVKYGSGANTFSADQGYSEHQLGTTIDFTTSETRVLAGFDKTTAFTWLTDNAYRYGFILSYPKGNSYYMYEPWHWRFVGVALATKLHDTGKNFYDLDQREIDTYRATMFDK